MIILKKGTADKIWYEDVSGKKITDKKILEYLATLRIPPAYQDVEIFYERNPKIVFEGTDSKGRRQQIYSAVHCKNACKKKFKDLIYFGQALPKIYAECDRNITNPNASTKDKIISIIIKIISLCYFRIGNIRYVKLYDHYGISTIKKSHTKMISNNQLQIKFVGKKGIVNECIIQDKYIIKGISDLIANKSPSHHVFTIDGEVISAVEINNWLQKFGDFSTKMFRNIDANILFVEWIRKEHNDISAQPIQMTETQRKKILVRALKDISQRINNTPAICKKAYLSADIIELYLKHPKKFKDMFLGSDTARVAVIKFLKHKHN